jgi:hypothetical protein
MTSASVLGLTMLRSSLCTYFFIEVVPGGEAYIWGGHSIGYSKQKVYMYMRPILNGF